jgi:hypothetical protein
VEPACAGALAVGALGDSAVVDFAGLGAQALEHAPALRDALAEYLPGDVLARPGRVLSGAQTAGPWRGRATHAKRCAQAQLGPVVLLGMIDAAGIAGRIGGGLIDVPAALFAQAARMLASGPA